MIGTENLNKVQLALCHNHKLSQEKEREDDENYRYSNRQNSSSVKKAF
jgi:hypothetical protein